MIILANVGVPMLPVQGIFMLLALLPIIVIEAVLLRWWMRGSWKQTMSGVAVGNVISAVIGVPVSWVIMFGIELLAFWIGCTVDMKTDSAVGTVAMVIAGAAWLGPAEDHLSWMIPLALAVLLIPCYFLSVWIEYQVLRRMWKGVDRQRLWSGVRLTNGVTYAILIAVCMGVILAGRK